MALFDRESDDVIQAAIDMHRLLEDYNAGRLQDGHLPIQIGIGVNTDSSCWEPSVIRSAWNLKVSRNFVSDLQAPVRQGIIISDLHDNRHLSHILR